MDLKWVKMRDGISLFKFTLNYFSFSKILYSPHEEIWHSLLLAINFILYTSCSQPPPAPTPTLSATFSPLPWEFDITIDNYRSHFKAVDIPIPIPLGFNMGNTCLYILQGGEEACIRFIGGGKSNPQCVTGDGIDGTINYFREGVGLRKPRELPYFMNLNIFKRQFLIINDTNFVINVKDLGEPFQFDKATSKYVNGRTGLIEIPPQKVKCKWRSGTDIDTICSISGKFIFSSARP